MKVKEGVHICRFRTGTLQRRVRHCENDSKNLLLESTLL